MLQLRARLASSLEKDFPPFAYNLFNLTSYARKNMALLKLLGVRDAPTVESVIGWIRALGGEAGVVGSADLETVASLLQLLVADQTVMTKYPADLPIPDQHGRLTPVGQIYLDDAAWLQHRIHSDRIRLAHPSVNSKTVIRLGIALLSRAVEEELEDGYHVPLSSDPGLNSRLAHWEKLVTSIPFRNGVYRIVKHEESRGQGKFADEDGEFVQRLVALADIKLVGAQALRSQFRLLPGREDITLEPAGSMAIVKPGELSTTLYAVTTDRRPRHVRADLCMSLNKYLGNCIVDKQPLERMLDCDNADEIEEELTQLRIMRSAGLDVGCGALLTKNQQNRLTPVPVGPDRGSLRPGAAVVVLQANGGGIGRPAYRHALIVSKGEAAGRYRLQIGAGRELFVDAGQLFMLKTDQQLREEVAAAEEAAHTAEREAVKRDPERYRAELAEEAAREAAVKQAAAVDAASRGEPAPEEEPAEVTRVLYKPEDPNWESQEAELLVKMQGLMAEREAALEPEPAGIDELLVKGGFPIPSASAGDGRGSAVADPVLAAVEEQVTQVNIRPGYDLVRVGNFDESDAIQPPEIAFFHHRLTLQTDFDTTRRRFVQQCCGVLRAVAAVYDYPHYLVTLFYQVPTAAAPTLCRTVPLSLADTPDCHFHCCCLYCVCAASCRPRAPRVSSGRRSCKANNPM